MVAIDGKTLCESQSNLSDAVFLINSSAVLKAVSEIILNERNTMNGAANTYSSSSFSLFY